jgi:hypothetical protein
LTILSATARENTGIAQKKETPDPDTFTIVARAIRVEAPAFTRRNRLLSSEKTGNKDRILVGITAYKHQLTWRNKNGFSRSKI